MSLTSGAVLSDRYRLLRLIATGGMGAVWEADDAVLDRRVAVKVLKPEYSSDAEFTERFRSEAKVTARISHPGVAAVYDYGQVPDPASGHPLSYLVMELVVGEPLSDVLAREGALPLRHTLDMLEQTGRALNAAHAIGLVHRDVKPGNILITPAGQVKLTDFGIAKSMGSSPVTQTGMVVGTAQYIAPEQAMGHDTTPAGDVYSLGVVGYECLAGQRPFTADSPVTIAMAHVRDTPPPLPGSVPAPVRRLVEHAMTKDPGRRYPSGVAFADAVADVRAGRDPRPPAAFGAAAAGLGAAGAAGAAGFGSGAGTTGATTVLPDDELGHRAGGGAPTGPTPTRAYTRLQPGQGGHGGPGGRPGTARQQSPSRRPAPTRRGPTPAPPPSRRPAGPPVSPGRTPARRGAGCGAWLLILLILLVGLLVAGAIALSNLGVFGPGGLFGGTTGSPTTSAPRTTQTPTPAPAPQPAPEPAPTPSSPPPAPPTTTGPDLQDMLDSLTAEFSDLLPPPAGNAPGAPGNSGNGAGGANPNAGANPDSRGGGVGG